MERTSLSLMDEQHRFVMIDTETKPRVVLGVTLGRTSPEQTVRYQLHNHLGSAALELNESAQVISYEEYHPYGTTAFQAKNSAIKAAAKRYRYTGMERDEESGLEYHSARYYLPWLGRWGSCDPIGIGDGVNVYAYCKGNSLLFKDGKGTAASTVGELIDEQAQETADRAVRTEKAGDYVKLFGWSFLAQTWKYFGAEGLSKTLEGKASTGDKVSAGIEVAAAIPFVGPLSKAAKALTVVKEAAPVVAHVAPVVVHAAPAVAHAAPAVAHAAPAVAHTASATAHSGSAAARAPIFADTNLLVAAAERGHAKALAEIRAGLSYITPNQLREFLNVATPAQAAARRAFLAREGIQLFGGPQAGQLAKTAKFQQVFQAVLRAGQGRGDASLAAFAKVTGFEAVTMERRLTNLLNNTLGQLGVTIRRVQ